MRFIKFIFLLSMIFIFSACAKTEAPVSKTMLMLDTVVTVSVYGDDAQRVLSGAFDLCEKYEAMLSKTIEGSDVYKLNHAKNQFVEVSRETLALLQKSVEYSVLSGGGFDVTIGAAINLWDFDAENENPALPPPDAIEKALKTVGYQNIEFDGRRVRLLSPGAVIDLGAIAKGFIADQIAAYLKSEGVAGAIIDLGGNILSVGEKPDGSPFIIGLREPFSETGATLLSLSMPEKSVVSSGVYERYFKLNGRLYHHILDTKTGYPIETDLVSVTIISDHSVDGDALSTAAFSLGREKGAALIESIPNTEAVFITSDNVIFCTAGLKEQFSPELLNDGYDIMFAKNE